MPTPTTDDENGTISVLIADDQSLIRAGFAMVINSQPDMKVVGEAADGQVAVNMVRQLKPDVVLMDVRMPVKDGIAATAEITSAPASKDAGGTDTGEQPHPTRVIILTTFDLDEYVMAAIKAGASGFLLKDTSPEDMLSSIRTVEQGNAIIAPSATKRLIQKLVVLPDSPTTVDASETGDSSGIESPELNSLTDREREVLIEIAHGLSNQEIADKLFISLPTVKTHVAHLLAKINARDRVQAVVFAYETGLVS